MKKFALFLGLFAFLSGPPAFADETCPQGQILQNGVCSENSVDSPASTLGGDYSEAGSGSSAGSGSGSASGTGIYS